jgi:hypothetical protein
MGIGFHDREYSPCYQTMLLANILRRSRDYRTYSTWLVISPIQHALRYVDCQLNHTIQSTTMPFAFSRMPEIVGYLVPFEN